MATHARQQYFADESSLSKEKREFSIAEEVQQKIDSIEEGAQVNTIETIKVNGNEVEPDENKAVDLTIPGVVDSLDSTSSTDALSARQGKVLYDYIQDVSHIGHFLALWDASTGLPVTDPETSPYIYNTGDFYTVSVVASGGGTNYKPDGTQYVIGQASTAVETDDIAVNDFYFYDGTTWRHMKNSGAGSIAIDGSLSTTSTNPVENRVITNALNNKAETTDVNTKTFRVTGTNDLVPFQAAYDYFVNGGWPIIIYGYSDTPYQGAYVIDRTSNVFQWSRTEQWYYSNSTESFACYVKLRPQLSGSTVTGMQFLFNSDTGYLDLYTNYGAPYIPLYPGSPATKKYVDDHAGTTYTAGANIQISAQNVISATDTTYTEGTGIDISNANVISADTTVLATKADLDEKQDALTAGDNITIGNVCVDISDMQGPAPDGFHIPLQSEWAAVKNIWTALGGSGSDGEVFGATLKMPLSGQRNYSDGSIYLPGNGSYWSSSYYGATNEYASKIYFNRFQILPYADDRRAYGQPIRAFKNTPVTPDSSWTMLYGTSIAAGGIFRSATEGLISLSSDGQTWVTMADKNLGATIVWNDGDTLSQNNSGNFYQWGNNYGFPYSGSITTSSTQVDATGYGPGNYYESDTFIIGSEDWSSVQNNNLWGGVSQGSTQECNLTISAQVPDSAEWGNITGTLSDQTDLQNALDAKADTTDVLTKANTTAYTPSTDYNPATKKYVDDSINGVNIKYWYLPSNSTLQDKIDTLQEIYDWVAPTSATSYKNKAVLTIGNVVDFLDWRYSYVDYTFSSRAAVNGLTVAQSGNEYTVGFRTITATISNGVVTNVTEGSDELGFLATNKDLIPDYTPTAPNHPATKKYVDDRCATVMTAAQYGQVSNPVAGKIYFIKES